MEDRVYTITDWYDGARAGVADFQGRPYYYECVWDTPSGNYSARYRLTPLEADAFWWALEDWAIWERWSAAFKAGETTHETHPSLPADRPRHDKLQALLAPRLRISADATLFATGEFDYRAQVVTWTRIE